MRIAKIRPLLIVTLGVTLLLHGPGLPAGAQTGEYVELFSNAATAREPIPASILGIAMPGSVERLDIDLEALRSSSSDFRKVRMTFGQGLVSLRVVRDKTEWSNDRAFSWFGKIENDGSSVLLSIHRDAVFGRIETGAGVYKIEPARGGYWLYQLDFSKEAKLDDGGVEPPVPYDISRADDRVVQKSAETTLNVFVVYTKGFKKAYPGSQLRAQIDLLINTANLAYNNSNVPLKLKVVGRKKRNYPDGGTFDDSFKALDDITKAVGVFSKVARWRDQFAADLVVLLRVKTEPGVCGLAWRMAELSVGFAPFGYSVVQVGRLELEGGGSTTCTDQTAAHEIGHNLGSNHNTGDSSIFSFSLGHLFGTLGTVMNTLPRSARVSYFSNPKVKFEGRKTGTTKLNNARSLTLVREIAGAWR